MTINHLLSENVIKTYFYLVLPKKPDKFINVKCQNEYFVVKKD